MPLRGATSIGPTRHASCCVSWHVSRKRAQNSPSATKLDLGSWSKDAPRILATSSSSASFTWAREAVRATPTSLGMTLGSHSPSTTRTAVAQIDTSRQDRI
jgi:hypothetical protein